MANTSWTAPPQRPLLSAGEIHLWRACMRREEALLCWPLLAEDEQVRARRFRFQQDRDRFVVARGVLRSILALYANTHPLHLRFNTTPYGKPFLDPSPTASNIQFNVSHAADLILYAVAEGPAVGIDVERMHPERVDEQVARQFLSPLELDHFCTLPIPERHEAFYAYWTRKEAFAKALGMGLQAPLRQISLSLRPRQHVFFSEDEQITRRWDIIALPIDAGYAAALAVEGPEGSLQYWQWQREANPYV